ncbi:MAG: inositol monophosphatase family protein [Elainella sp. Prado103]|nr:inositol monophosphatase family protein [Elainella sp. Prado103]
MHYLSNSEFDAITQLMRSCGQSVPQLAQQSFQVYEKGRQDYVTDVDRALDQQLTEQFTTLFPADRVITEENSDSWQAFLSDATRLWLIDPLDGTDDFIQGAHYYALMAGLLVQHQPIAGWIYAPMFDHLYFGGSEFGIFEKIGDHPPQPLQPQTPAPPSEQFCPILLGHKDQKRFGSAIQQHIPAARFDCVGSFGLKVMQVLTGQAGLYIYLNGRVKLWDTTGPLAIAQAAGLMCCDLSGEPLRFTPDRMNLQTLAHQQPILIGWPGYLEALLPQIQAAVLSASTYSPS